MLCDLCMCCSATLGRGSPATQAHHGTRNIVFGKARSLVALQPLHVLLCNILAWLTCNPSKPWRKKRPWGAAHRIMSLRLLKATLVELDLNLFKMVFPLLTKTNMASEAVQVCKCSVSSMWAARHATCLRPLLFTGTAGITPGPPFSAGHCRLGAKCNPDYYWKHARRFPMWGTVFANPQGVATGQMTHRASRAHTKRSGQ